ncbi:hypothetical protein SAMN05216505_12426 [Streptomyces prasinopilosus]|uniref:Uncharacterized protein n=1 Tax=Streptomyces prasinopilosus TaxID=67344 RepID=A0A1G7BMB2_9ACTN|nr:hypothetical protein SAMN05216505_12426 [Streptomyces prasinopilosus]
MFRAAASGGACPGRPDGLCVRSFRPGLPGPGRGSRGTGAAGGRHSRPQKRVDAWAAPAGVIGRGRGDDIHECTDDLRCRNGLHEARFLLDECTGRLCTPRTKALDGRYEAATAADDGRALERFHRLPGPDLGWRRPPRLLTGDRGRSLRSPGALDADPDAACPSASWRDGTALTRSCTVGGGTSGLNGRSRSGGGGLDACGDHRQSADHGPEAGVTAEPVEESGPLWQGAPPSRACRSAAEAGRGRRCEAPAGVRRAVSGHARPAPSRCRPRRAGPLVRSGPLHHPPGAVGAVRPRPPSEAAPSAPACGCGLRPRASTLPARAQRPASAAPPGSGSAARPPAARTAPCSPPARTSGTPARPRPSRTAKAARRGAARHGPHAARPPPEPARWGRPGLAGRPAAPADVNPGPTEVRAVPPPTAHRARVRGTTQPWKNEGPCSAACRNALPAPPTNRTPRKPSELCPQRPRLSHSPPDGEPPCPTRGPSKPTPAPPEGGLRTPAVDAPDRTVLEPPEHAEL